jgi:hypothetical protein
MLNMQFIKVASQKYNWIVWFMHAERNNSIFNNFLDVVSSDVKLATGQLKIIMINKY